jgi:phage tail-like protein
MAIDDTLLGPYPAYNFYIALIDTSSTFSSLTSGVSGFVLGGFAECSGLDASLDIQEYKEGGVNDRVHKFPTRSSFANVSLKRGVGFGEDLWLWYEEFLNGEGTRRNGLIVLANELRAPIKIWSFENGIPIKWSGPSLNATTSALAIESIEIAHEKLTLTMSPGKAVDGLVSAVT